MREQVKQNQILIMVLIVVIGLLYSVAGTSDRLDGLTAQQQSEVVARWSQP